MSFYFTSASDLLCWMEHQRDADEAIYKIIEVIGEDFQQDIVEACRLAYGNGDENAANVILEILKNKIKPFSEVKNMNQKIKKEAQVMRSDSLYGNMPMRICPKLPNSAGKRLISTYNCRHHCLDSLVLDDDPNRVYCQEALWRQHIMDKFSREWKTKEGKYVGGYINNRFTVSHDDGGNNMQLADGERSRMPRPHQYSVERRLQEQRNEKPKDIVASSKKIVKIASVEQSDAVVNKMFTAILDLREVGKSDSEILTIVSEYFGESIIKTASLMKIASKMQDLHKDTCYTYDNSFKKKASNVWPKGTTLVCMSNVNVVPLASNQVQNNPVQLPIGSVVVVHENSGSNIEFQMVDGQNAGSHFYLQNPADINKFQVYGASEQNASQQNIETQRQEQPIGADLQEVNDEIGLSDNSGSSK